MATENAIQESSELYEEAIDFDELERILKDDLNSQFSDLDSLIKDKEKISNPESLGDTVMDVIWEQFLNQIAVTAGEDFIRENRGLTLDLRNKSHIQTTENFETGKIAAHNDKINYQERYDEMRKDFQTDPNATVIMKKNMRYNETTDVYERFDSKEQKWIGKTRYNKETMVWEDWDTREKSWKKKLAPDARKKFDTRDDTQKGSKAVPKDHTISAAGQIRDMDAAAHLDRETRKDFAKSDVNLNDLDARANSSKGDLPTPTWLDTPREDGQTQAEYFGLNEEELREQYDIAEKEYGKLKDKGKKTSIETGRQSQKEEAFRITGKALRTVIMQLLAELIKTIISKLVAWIRNGKRDLESFINQIKAAITSFVSNMKTHLLNISYTLVTTIATAIFEPTVRFIKKVFVFLKQGVKSIKEAIDYIKSPSNKDKPIGTLMLEVGKIVVTGVSAMGAIALGEVIEKGLTGIPGFGFEIPLFGSLASILGIFMGALVSGIIGALVINLIDKVIADKQLSENTKRQISKGNEILNTQNNLLILQEKKLYATKRDVSASISAKNQKAGQIMKDIMTDVFQNDFYEELKANEEPLKEIDLLLSELQSQ